MILVMFFVFIGIVVLIWLYETYQLFKEEEKRNGNNKKR